MQGFSEGLPASDPQVELQLLRETLLSGRGPGAAPGEILLHTRWRTEVAGVPVPALLERTAQRAARLRGDAVPPAVGGFQRPGLRPASALTVMLFAVLLLTARRLLRRQPPHRGRGQMPAREA